MGYLFQGGALYDSMSVRENLEFPIRRTQLSDDKKEVENMVVQALKSVGLLDAIDKMPAELSGGMKKRIGLARALILKPEIILYDDPTAGLDPITSRMIVELIIKLNKEFKATSVAITNDMNRAYQFADRIGLLMDHQLTLTGTVEETKKHKDPRVQKFIRGEFSLKDLEEEN